MQPRIVTINVLITCYNRITKTVACLDALFKQRDSDTFFKLVVYLVDDGSTDDTSGIVSTQFPNVKIIQGDGNLFWNRGMNLAWYEASKNGICDYFLWLNNDTYLFEYTISSMLAISKDTNIICASTCSSITGNLTYSGINKASNSLLVPNGTVQPCDLFTGNCVLIPYVVFRKLGFLNAKYHHAIGDFDYGLRAAKNGIRSYIAPMYGGTCELHTEKSIFFNPATTLAERWRALYKSSCICHPQQRFTFEREHKGIITAILHFVTIHIRVAIPSLWKVKAKFVAPKQGVPL